MRDYAFGDRLAKGQEAVVLGHEIGFAIDFNQRACRAGNVGRDHAFGGDARGGLAGLVAQLDAQDFFGFFKVAIGLGQCFFALHHWGVGLGAQLCDHACCNCHCHFQFSVCRFDFN